MPNHVTNVLTLHGESDQIRAMLEAIQYDDLGIGSVDFNKIIPMPESLNIEAGSQTSTGLKAYQDFIEVYTLGGTIHQDDLENIPRKSEDAFLRQRSDIRPKEWKLGKAAWNNIRLYGVPTWYGWRNQHWGTKWNSYGYGEAEVNYQEGDALNFLTAWSAPHPVMEKLAEMFPNVEIEHEWADEDIGHNCGRYRYQNGVRIEEWIPETEREAIDLGCELMGLEPLDYGLALNTAVTNAAGSRKRARHLRNSARNAATRLTTATSSDEANGDLDRGRCSGAVLRRPAVSASYPNQNSRGGTTHANGAGHGSVILVFLASVRRKCGCVLCVFVRRGRRFASGGARSQLCLPHAGRRSGGVYECAGHKCTVVQAGGGAAPPFTSTLRTARPVSSGRNRQLHGDLLGG